MTTPDMTALKEKLLARRQELVDRLTRIDSTLDEPANADVEERAVEREDDEVLRGLGHAGQQELRAIDAALERMTAGSYGICESCGEEIAAERLEALPTTMVCVKCAA